MRFSVRCFGRWATIICLLLGVLTLSGCGAARLGYNSAPALGYWWMDGYVDFDNSQSLRVKTDLQALQDWHRKEELPIIAEMLKNLQASAAQNVTPEQVCTLSAYMLGRVQAAGDRMVPSATAVIPTLQAAQFEHMAKAFDKRNRQWREDWLDGTPAERQERRVKSLVDRAESFYGRLTDAQVRRVSAQLEATPFDAAIQYREILRRQQDGLQTLRQLRYASPPATEIHLQAEVRALLVRALQSPDPAYRQYLEQLTQQGCATVADLHNSTSPAQRTKLAQTLQGYEADARSLQTR
jgi:NADH:ubiquinone oxidoreductase subunit E